MMANKEGYPEQLQFPAPQTQEIPNFPPPSYSACTSSTDQSGRETTEYTKESETQASEEGPKTDKPDLEDNAYKDHETQSTESAGSSTGNLGRENTAYAKDPETQFSEPNDELASGSSNSYPGQEKFHNAQTPSAPIDTQADYHSNDDLHGYARPGPSGLSLYHPDRLGSTPCTRDEVVVIQPLPSSPLPDIQHPSDHLCLTWTILICVGWINCCWPCAIAGVIYSHKTREANIRGDWVSAQEYSTRARNWALACVALTIFTSVTIALIQELRP